MTKIFYYSPFAAIDRVQVANGSFIRVEEVGNSVDDALYLAQPREDGLDDSIWRA